MSVRYAFVALALFVLLGVPGVSRADDTSDNIQLQIDSLKNEIEQLTIQLNNTTAQKSTLQNAVKQLDLQIQTLTKSITLTNAQISQKDREINNLSGNIATTSTEISRSEDGVAASLRNLYSSDQEPVMLTFLSGGTLSTFFDESVALGSLRDDLFNKVEDLSALKSNLVTTKTSTEGKRQELAALQSKLASQQAGIKAARTEQNTLLAETKNKESSYQSLIADKKAQQQKFEQDLLAYEDSLGLSVAAGSLPSARAGILHWPLDSIKITQYFGNTEFATQNPQIYSGHGHTGVDFGASTGTRVLSALDGVVLGTGNTDLTCPNASFGKWVFVKHPNGLSTLYAHLSVISVTTGQTVSTGQVVGYSGSTGYATGPHLHLGVYAASGVQIMDLGKYRGSTGTPCTSAGVVLPVAPTNAYLNPLSYLPAS